MMIGPSMADEKLPILGRVDTRKRLLRPWQGFGRAMILSRMRNHPRPAVSRRVSPENAA